MQYELIDNDIAKISFDNGKANPISLELAHDIMAGLERAKDEAKGVLITGNPGMFSAGFDLKVLAKGMDAAQEMLDQGMVMLAKLYAHPQPVVTACEGHCVGLGVFIMLSADYRVGGQGDFSIRLPETAIGMPFTPCLKTIAKSHIDPRHHSQAIIQSRPYTPDTAAKIGMLDEVVAADQVVERAVNRINELCELPSEYYAINKLDIRAEEIDQINRSLGLT